MNEGFGVTSSCPIHVGEKEEGVTKKKLQYDYGQCVYCVNLLFHYYIQHNNSPGIDEVCKDRDSDSACICVSTKGAHVPQPSGMIQGIYTAPKTCKYIRFSDNWDGKGGIGDWPSNVFSHKEAFVCNDEPKKKL